MVIADMIADELFDMFIPMIQVGALPRPNTESYWLEWPQLGANTINASLSGMSHSMYITFTESRVIFQITQKPPHWKDGCYHAVYPTRSPEPTFYHYYAIDDPNCTIETLSKDIRQFVPEVFK